MFKRILSFLLIAVLLFTFTGIHNTVVASETQKQYIPISVLGKNSLNYYEVIVKDNEIFLSAEDVQEITGFDYAIRSDKSNFEVLGITLGVIIEDEVMEFNGMSPYNKFTKVTIELWKDILINGVVKTTNRNELYKKTTARGVTHNIPVLNIDNTYYLPLEKILVLLLCEWLVQDEVLLVSRPQENIFTFYERNFDTIQKHNSYKSDLYVNDDGKWTTAIKNVLSSLIEDFNPCIFIPGGVNKMIAEDYENALLMIAHDDNEYFNTSTMQTIDKFLKDDPFSDANTDLNTALTIINIPSDIADIMEGIDYYADWSVTGINKVINGINKLLKNGSLEGISSLNYTKLIREGSKGEATFNYLQEVTPPRIRALSKHLETVSDVTKLAQIIENAQVIASRSKQWNDDFIRQLETLAEMDDKDDDGWTKSAAKRLIEEYNDPKNAVAEDVLWNALGMMADKLWGLTPAGKFFNLVSTGVYVANEFLRFNEIEDKIKARAIGYEINYLINIEIIARGQRNDKYKTLIRKINGESNSGIKYSDIQSFRDSLMLSLKAALRNKAIVYNYISVLDKNWTQEKASQMNNDIAEIYSLIIRLMETELYDVLLVENNLNNYYSQNGKVFVRKPISEDIIVNEDPLAVYSTDLDAYIKAQDNNFQNVDSELINNELETSTKLFIELSYTLINLDNNAFPELIIARNLSDVRSYFDIDYCIYDIYGYINGTVQRLFDPYEYSMGYRGTFAICENSVIRCDASGSAAHSSTEYFSLNNISGFPICVLRIDKITIYKDGDTKYFIINGNDETEITKEEYQSIRIKYGLKNNIKWIKLP